MTMYIFYQKDKDGYIFKTYNKLCVRPKSTNVYKHLLRCLDTDSETEQIGYCAASQFKYPI